MGECGRRSRVSIKADWVDLVYFVVCLESEPSLCQSGLKLKI